MQPDFPISAKKCETRSLSACGHYPVTAGGTVLVLVERDHGYLEGEHTMTTGKRAASKASKELRNRRSTTDEKTVAGSDLAQAKHRPKKRRR